MEYDILILIGGGGGEVYKSLIEAQRRTWGIIKNPKIKVLYYFGGAKKLYVKDDEIYCNTPPGDPDHLLGLKTLNIFKYVKDNYNFKHMFRTTCASYLRQDKMLDFVKNKPINNLYCGIGGLEKEGVFLSGAGYFLSKNLMDKIEEKRNLYRQDIPEDVALGCLLTQHLNVEIDYGGMRHDIFSVIHNGQSVRTCLNRQTHIHSVLKSYNDESFKTAYHIRMHSYDRKLDVYEMFSLHQHYYR